MAARDLSASLQRLFLEELDERLRDFDIDVAALESAGDEPGRTALVNRLFRGAHSLKGAASTVGANPIELVCHQLEDFLGELRDGRVSFAPGHADVLLATTAALRAAGRELADGKPGIPAVTDLAARLAAPPTAPTPPAAPAPSSPPPTPAPPLRERTLRVASESIDGLLQQSSELIVARMRNETLRAEIAAAADLAHRIRRGLEQPAALRDLERALDHIASAADLDRVALEGATNALDAGLRALRMVPFARVCEGLDRIVDDAAAASGKRIALEIVDGEIGLDRTIVERVRDPLVHLVRNAVDHGIELPEQRAAAGKPPAGTIRLGAALHGGHVEITVVDDGRGIDGAELRRRASERGLEHAGVDPTALAFLPGISTATTVTGRSGRGVGLDAVRTEIEALRGTVSVASQPHAGTRFTLTLPFTLTTMRVVLFVVGGQTYAINAGWARRFVRVEPERCCSVQGRAMLLVDAEPIPLVAVADVLGGAVETEPRSAIVVDALGAPLALAVDALLDERDIVFRSLGPRLIGVKHVSGASILGDGSVALILRGSVLAADAVALARRTRPAAAPALADAAPKRILLVDDSVTTRALERSILEAAGYDVVTAADGTDAWQLLAAEETVDLVVSDVDMPRMDGFALVESMRRSSRLRDVPVILVTARDSDVDRRRGLEAGADAYIVKSGFRQETLLDAIGELV